MDLAFLNTLTEAQRAALAVLAQDLENYGVTDSLAESALGLNNMVKAAPAAPAPQKPQAQTQAQTATQPAAPTRTTTEKPKKAIATAAMPQSAAQHSAQPFVLDEHLKHIEGTLPFTVVLAATDRTSLWTAEEQELWQNMMRAIGFEGENPTFQLLIGDAAGDAALPSNHEASLRDAMIQSLKNQPVLVMGHRALDILSAGAGNAASVRRKEWQLKTPENRQKDGKNDQKVEEKGCFFTLVATYHGHTLLRQPFLKRQTWADLLTLKQALEEGKE